MKKIVILGSTGSIGRNALDVVRAHPGRFKVVGLAAHSNAKALAKQVAEFRPRWASLFDAEAGSYLRECLDGFCRALPHGVEGLVDMSSRAGADLVLTSLVGGVGFRPLLAAIRGGKDVAIANKEPMVMAGAQFMAEARRRGARILPVDSEPSAIFQCLGGRFDASGAVRRIFLTASGGAFYRRKGPLSAVTVDEALRHPTWKMGRKITIDSATLMNKGFEAIEISNLFNIPLSKIEVVVHPQSILHSAVEFNDGSIIAQLSHPDMRLPIQYAMTYPERPPSVVRPLGLSEMKRLDFETPDLKRFQCLALALEAGRQGGAMPAVLNAADEVAVAAFLGRRIRFTDIPRVVDKTMSKLGRNPLSPSFEDVIEIDAWARSQAARTVRGIGR